jgi:3-hydroxyisobutyrate dehydrogenase-like beta-hydroxyacid dehydrogenase
MDNDISLLRVGVLGLGIMGMAYAANLRRAGAEVWGYDPLEDARAALKAIGGTACASPIDVARGTEVILLALPSANVLETLVSEILPHLHASHVLAEMSTLALSAKEAARVQCATRGAVLLDCPVSGTGAQAQKGDLVVFASGPQADIKRLNPVFATLARDIRHVGPFGAGMKLKFVANLLVTIHNLAAAEALLMAQKSGLDLDMVFEAIRSGAGNSRMFEVRGPMMIAGQYTPATMKMDVYQKDLALIMEHSRKLGIPVPLMAASLPIYAAALTQGRDKEDTAALFAVLQQMTAEDAA